MSIKGPRMHNQHASSGILEKYGILDKRQCGFRKHSSPTDHLVSLERYVRVAFAWKQQAVGLFDLEKAYKTTRQNGIIRDLHRIGLSGRLSVFVSEYSVNISETTEFGSESGTNSDEFYSKVVPTGCILAFACFWLKLNELPSLIAMNIFRVLCWWSGDLFTWPLPWYYRKKSIAGSKCHTGMGNKARFHVCSQ